MDHRHLPPGQQVQVSERVTFTNGHHAFSGYVASKGRTYAWIITDDGTEYRVPFTKLSRVVGALHKQVQRRTDRLRAQFHAGDQVGFTVGASVLHGTISRLNPTSAHVVCDDDREYRVPYACLTPLERQPDMASRSRQRTDGALAAIAARAGAWIVAHHLEGWSFQFDHATKRAGCCNYHARVISLAHAYAQYATHEEIDDTILHEIAHALVGQAHGHDQVWQATAVALGCSGQRCHDVQFTPPRYIVTCEHACWVTTAERRKRGAVCRTCHGQVRYATYTEERWQQARTGS